MKLDHALLILEIMLGRKDDKDTIYQRKVNKSLIESIIAIINIFSMKNK